ncbi:hypothetical protein GUA87_16915 [Sneathiella sp. P13V-1]|uniref:dihydrofolate reductase n=1 Tax=Sneathiella sp. P13V-1 TaxID=2697366 RepID=UPI00187B8D9A|nr:dihydrofolate reductase [Sneathiella sp. P13V-1]MBE7638540.1 hypothetical protein [Sneathiella sp. P13V-1]
MKISAILAASENNIIGMEGDMPWHLPNDLKWFKKNTLDKPMIMGRKTFQSLPGLLPGRTSIILTRDPSFSANGALVANDVETALELASEDCRNRGTDEIMIVGGGEIYKLFFEKTERFYLTRVHTDIEGDTSFFDLNEGDWVEKSKEKHSSDEKNQFDHTFMVLDRKK